MVAGLTVPDFLLEGFDGRQEKKIGATEENREGGGYPPLPVIFIVYFVSPFVTWLHGGKLPWFMGGEILFVLLVAVLGFAISFGAMFLGDRLSRRVRGLSANAALLAVLEFAVFLVLSVALAWLLCHLL